MPWQRGCRGPSQLPPYKCPATSSKLTEWKSARRENSTNGCFTDMWSRWCLSVAASISLQDVRLKGQQVVVGQVGDVGLRLLITELGLRRKALSDVVIIPKHSTEHSVSWEGRGWKRQINHWRCVSSLQIEVYVLRNIWGIFRKTIIKLRTQIWPCGLSNTTASCQDALWYLFFFEGVDKGGGGNTPEWLKAVWVIK